MKVRTPASDQATRMPVMVGTSRVISEGCTKIEVPMIVPDDHGRGLRQADGAGQLGGAGRGRRHDRQSVVEGHAG